MDTEHAELDSTDDWQLMDLAAAQPYYVLGLLPPEVVPSIAYNDLLRGKDGEALLELASLSRPTWRDIGTLMDRALVEVGLPKQTTDQAWRAIASHVLDRVDAGAISLNAAGRQLDALTIAADSPQPLLPLQGLDDYLDLGLLTDEQWEVALRQEFVELRARLVNSDERIRFDEFGLGVLYWLRRYGTPPEPTR